MNNIKLIIIVLIISFLFFSGCVQAPEGTPTPTATPTVTETVPVVVPTTQVQTPIPTPVKESATYRMDVDDDYGFYRIRVINSNLTPSFYNFTLTVSSGDKLIFVSDSDYTITIVSEQGLWDNTSAKLRWSYQEYNYTFTQPGTYDVYIKEYPRKRLKIIVNP